ncbi:sugar ABC transporter substrate-binding protein [Microbacterium sp. NIBRBAC000506063]|uniref:sugar ABC transporter substrate-binding protein n=1 Tax=Microbacterium sp. NIBRBAC000506063 TaxID=2734618 RepID=UPI001CB6DF0B|nr:sugar ABC transporter substrate-binding protein [Microbacterium sp. NIBRBAC000506063]
MNATAFRGKRALGLAAAGLMVLSLAACASNGDDPEGEAPEAPEAAICAPEDIQLIGQVRNETNPYEKSWLDGGDVFAESVGLTQTRLTYDSESPRQQEQIRQALATSSNPECMVLNVLPNGDSDTTPIVRETNAAGALLVTHWNKPADMTVSDYDNWITHIAFDDQAMGKQIAEAIFEEMGGEGGIIALQGILATSAAQDRFAGLEEALAENSGIELLADQVADFGRTEGFEVTRTLLTQHGDKVKGIWAANDDMALGALQAVVAAGMEGQVAIAGIDAVPEAVQAIVDGQMVATASVDGPWQGGVGLAMGYCALTGEIDIESLSADKRGSVTAAVLVDGSNASDFLEPQADPADFACDRVFDRVLRGLN